MSLLLELSDFQWTRKRRRRSERETVKGDDRMTEIRAGGWILKKKKKPSH